MTGALGAYPMERESSGTAWQPDSSEHAGLHVMSGDWMLMAHGYAWASYTDQSGPRGGDKLYAQSMAMAMLTAPFTGGRFTLNAMMSADPAMKHDG